MKNLHLEATEEKTLLVLREADNKLVLHTPITDTRWTESAWGGDVLEEYQRPYTEDRIMVQFITHIDFEEGKQFAINYAKRYNRELDLTTLKLNGDTITCNVKSPINNHNNIIPHSTK